MEAGQRLDIEQTRQSNAKCCGRWFDKMRIQAEELEACRREISELHVSRRQSILTRILEGPRVFTVTEFLAAIAIVATVVGIVALLASALPNSHRSTQPLESKTIELGYLGFTGANAIEQEISSQWPESFASDVYVSVFQVTKEGDTIVSPAPEKTVSSIAFLDEQGQRQVVTVGDVPAIVTVDPSYTTWTVSRGDVSISLDADHLVDSLTLEGMVYTFELDAVNGGLIVTTGGRLISGGITAGEARVFDVKDLLERFTAVDRAILEARGVSTSALTNLTDTSLDATSAYLWLLEKDAAASAHGKVTARQVTVYALISATPAIDPGARDLTFQRLRSERQIQ